MVSLDAANACFVLLAVAAAINDVLQLRRDKHVQGVTLSTAALLTLWPIWDCCYYFGLGQACSLFACFALVSARATWVALAWRYEHASE